MWSDSVKVQLQELTRLDPAAEYTESETGYSLNAPLTHDDLDSIERVLQQELPQAYRVFLMDVGNGGAGPGTGVRFLDLNEIDWDVAKLPFPFSESYREQGSVEERNRCWEARNHGLLTLADYGCGQFAELILNGPFAGEIWVSNWPIDAGIQRFGNYISEHDETMECGDFGVSFDQWYSTWLSGQLATIARKPDEPDDARESPS